MNANPAPRLLPRAPLARLATWLTAGVIALAAAFAHRGSLSAPFVLDDQPAITDNFSIRSFATAWSPPKEITTTGRPVVNLSLAVNYALGGLDVRGYHAVNLAIHILAALALFGVVRRTLQNPRTPPALARDATFIAGGIALLWALHPLQTESVTYTIQRAESLMGLFYLLTLYAFIRGCCDESRGPASTHAWLALSFAACLLGMATKEVMATAPLLVLLYDRTFVAGSFRAALRVRGKFYAALAATWLVLAVLVLSAENRGGTAGLGAKISPLDYALTQCPAIVHYLRLALWPAPLIFDYGNAPTTQLAAILAPALLLLALVAGALVALRARPVLGFLGVWFFAILAPSSSVVPIATQTIAEHRMYLSLAAVLTLLVVTLYRWAGRRVAVATVIVAAMGLAALTSERNATYRDAVTLWGDTATKAPGNSRAAINLGFALLQSGRPVEAEQTLAALVQRQPDSAEAKVNYASILLAANRPDEAIAQLESALRLEPDNLEAHNNLGITLGQRGRIADALPHFERALQLKPAAADGHLNLALALAQAGREEEALVHLVESTRLRPADPFARDSYGFALFRAGRLPEAIRELETALRSDPKSAAAHYHLGLALTQSGRAGDGLTHFELAVQLAPADAALHNTFGVALASADRLTEALRQFDRALALKPDFADAAQNRDRARAQLVSQ